MKGWIIINNYDSGVNYSITIDGLTASRECLEEWIIPLDKKRFNDHKTIRDIIKDSCDFQFYDVHGELNNNLWQNICLLFARNIIVCENGNTEIIKYCKEI